MSSHQSSAVNSLRMGEVILEQVQDGITGETKDLQYTQSKIIGNGSFGIVYQAKLSPSGEDAAIKRALQDKRFKNRELEIMRILQHPNIVQLKAFYYSRGDRKDEVYLNLIQEFVPETVYRASRFFTKRKTTMPIIEVKLYIYQLFRALAYIHSRNICHRDIKPQNILLDPNSGIIKLCDFGSAKTLVENEPNVSYICSRYYRAPELVFGATNYTNKIDLWSSGCVMAELMLGQPLFPGESGIDQLVEIIKVLGTPTREQIRTMNPNYTEHKFPQIKPHPLNKVFRRADSNALDLIARLLKYTPTERRSAIDAMAQPFFDELRDPNTKLPDSRNGSGQMRDLPDLFNFSEHELSIAPELNHRLVPAHTRPVLASKTPGGPGVGDSKSGGEEQDEWGRTPLSRAAKEGLTNVVARMLDTEGIEADSRDKSGRTPLSLAAENGQLVIVELLLDKGFADPESKDAEGKTPLWWAAEKRHDDIVKVLLDSCLATRTTDGPALLQSAIADRHMSLIKVLVCNYFDSVAQGEYGWLAALRNEGLDATDIAVALQATSENEPWILSANPDVQVPLDKIDVDLHQPCCAHKLRQGDGKGSSDGTSPDPLQEQFNRVDMQRRVALFCGLAGVFPPGGWSSSDYGRVNLSAERASIIYRGELDTSEQSSELSTKLISQLHEAAKGLTFAAVTLQKTGFCCNQFTVLTTSEQGSSPENMSVVRMNTISFDLLVELAQSIEALQSRGLSDSTLPWSVDISTSIMERLFETTLIPPSTMEHKLHLCSLTVQLLCLGLVFYAQAHTGVLHPDYLAEPLHEIMIRGSSPDQPYIICERYELACLGEMVDSKVFVSRLSSETPSAGSETFYLSATCEDIVDSWGPGALILDPRAPSAENILGLVIRGGIVKPDRRLDNGDRLLHWGEGSGKYDVSRSNPFSYRDRIVVGTTAVGSTAPVMTEKNGGGNRDRLEILARHDAPDRAVSSAQRAGHAPRQQQGQQARKSTQEPAQKAPVSPERESHGSAMYNHTCPRSIVASRTASQSFLAELATSPSCWMFIERSMMLQFGDKVVAQVGGTQVKQAGVPLKRAFLDRWTNEGKLSQFEEPWGLQVSLCTGVARRVPLRVLLRDDLVDYINSLRMDGWPQLQPAATEAMASKEQFAAWSEQLTSAELRCMQDVFSRLLVCLKDTGFDKSELEFSILWPYESDARFCVKVPPEEDHEWCQMLKDKEWSATFAVATNLCLEAPSYRCRQMTAAEWRGAKMLSTFVLPSLVGINPSTIKYLPGEAWQIEHDRRYWNGKVGEKVQFLARKEHNAVTKLEIQRNRLEKVPKRFWSLFPLREVLVERSNVDFRSEEVVVIPQL